ncbi:MAG: hypothetical protein WBF17_11250 [Phycisphaerae bacterium]
MTRSRTTLTVLVGLAASWGAMLAGPAKPPARSAHKAQTAAPAAAKAPKGLVPIPLELPKPTVIPTPRNIPPKTRVKVPKGRWAPRGPFYAPKGVRNVALKKPVTGSDMEPVIGTLELITDGEREAGDDTYVELGFGVHYVQIDLQKMHSIHAVVVWHEFFDRRVYHDVIVQVADDKDFITNVRTLYNNDHDNSAGMGLGKDWGYFETHEGLLVDAKAVKARYVRLYSNGSTGDELNRYTEVAVFGLQAK